MNKYQASLNAYNFLISNLDFDKTEINSNIQELVDKATPKKPLNIKQNESTCGNTIGNCPNCKNMVIGDCYEYKEKFCRECGQALDWITDEK